MQSARWHCEYLRIFFESHRDKEFRTELRGNFDARYWEMYLTVSLILAGYAVTCPKPGPDAGIIYRGQRIWFEANSHTRPQLHCCIRGRTDGSIRLSADL
jgi:hypothetical protein